MKRYADEASSDHLWPSKAAGAEVLVVDDAPMNRAILRAHLAQMGHAATEVADGMAALNSSRSGASTRSSST